MAKPAPNFICLDPGRLDVAILIEAMIRAREVIGVRSWSSPQEPITEAWWADVLADPRARIRRKPVGYGHDVRRTAQRTFYRLADEPRPVIEVACSKCAWKAAFGRAELVASHGAEYRLPDLLDHLAMPGCPKIKSQWDRCGVHYLNPIEGGRANLTAWAHSAAHPIGYTSPVPLSHTVRRELASKQLDVEQGQ